jgi:hypothetical protein
VTDFWHPTRNSEAQADFWNPTGFFRYGNSARAFDMIQAYTLGRLALFMAKRHKRSRGWGWSLVAYGSPDHFGLISLEGTVLAPRPNRPWRGSEHRR